MIRPRRRCLLPLLLGALLVAPGCAEKTKASGGRRNLAGAAPVLVGTVQRKPVPLTLDAVGAIEAMQSAAVRSQVTGTALKIHFQEGQDVQQGDLLFEIDSRPFRLAAATAEAETRKIRAQLEHAGLQVTRYAALNQDKMVSNEQYQTMQVTERALTAQLAAAESALAAAKLQVEYCSIRAPVGGRTGGLGAHVGDLIRASDANVALVTVNQVSPIYATFGVPQQFLGALTKYRAAGAVSVTATPLGAAGSSETGELSFIDNAVDAATGTVRLKATFANASRHLWPGQFVTIRVTLANPEALVVPAAALQNSQKGQHVYVVREDRTVELRPVTIERTQEGDAVVASGLREKEIVVVDGQLRVTPGRAVEIKTPVTASVAGERSASGGKKRKAE